jgi:hypothetical protein
MGLQVAEHNVRVEFLRLPKPAKPRRFFKRGWNRSLKGNRIDLPTQRLRRLSEFDLVQPTACVPDSRWWP